MLRVVLLSMCLVLDSVWKQSAALYGQIGAAAYDAFVEEHVFE